MHERIRNGGFTMAELMIVMAIIGILASIAIPSFNELIKNNRRSTVVNELVGNLMLARAEAAKRGQPVTICGNTNGGGNSCTAAGTWNYGWMMFVDINDNGAIGDVLGEELLRKFENPYGNDPLHNGDITITSVPGSNSPSAGVFVVRPFTRTSTNGTFRICDKRGSPKARSVIVSGNGRARVSDNAVVCP